MHSGCVFLANSAFIQTCVMWVTLIPLLYKFNRYAKTRYGAAVAHMCAPPSSPDTCLSIPSGHGVLDPCTDLCLPLWTHRFTNTTFLTFQTPATSP